MTDKIRRALVSVSDKSGLVELGRYLTDNDVEILSTGGSAKALRDAGVAVIEVSDFTGFPEIMDGRVKTLQPTIHGGLLAIRGNAEHEAAMEKHKIAPIDLLVVNLYPFEATVASGAGADDCIENIDIGGPALIRAAAKNHAFVSVVVDPADYGQVIEEMTANGGATTKDFKRQLAGKAYARTAAYDSAIGDWFGAQLGETFPERLTLSGTLKQSLRYGENPHQQAALYVGGKARPGVANAIQIQGKELSFNNLNDTDAAFELVSEFDETACAIIKHANPCGAAVGASLSEAYMNALYCDPISAFGGIVAFNRPLDGETAAEIAKIFVEVIIAPHISDEAKEVLARKKNLRVLETGGMPDPREQGMTVRSLSGGYLFQTRDDAVFGEDVTCVTERQPTDTERDDLMFAYKICKHVKSNAIIYIKDRKLVGVGAGQMSRVDSAKIAAIKSKEASENAGEATLRTTGSVVASDAFFPFADGLLAAAEAGATAVIQPGGSMRDNEVIAAANEKGLAMLMTGMRHFRH